MSAKKKFRIPGLTFSWKRALGITKAKRKIAAPPASLRRRPVGGASARDYGITFSLVSANEAACI